MWVNCAILLGLFIVQVNAMSPVPGTWFILDRSVLRLGVQSNSFGGGDFISWYQWTRGNPLPVPGYGVETGYMSSGGISLKLIPTAGYRYVTNDATITTGVQLGTNLGILEMSGSINASSTNFGVAQQTDFDSPFYTNAELSLGVQPLPLDVSCGLFEQVMLFTNWFGSTVYGPIQNTNVPESGICECEYAPNTFYGYQPGVWWTNYRVAALVAYFCAFDGYTNQQTPLFYASSGNGSNFNAYSVGPNGGTEKIYGNGDPAEETNFYNDLNALLGTNEVSNAANSAAGQLSVQSFNGVIQGVQMYWRIDYFSASGGATIARDSLPCSAMFGNPCSFYFVETNTLSLLGPVPDVASNVLCYSLFLYPTSDELYFPVSVENLWLPGRGVFYNPDIYAPFDFITP